MRVGFARRITLRRPRFSKVLFSHEREGEDARDALVIRSLDNARYPGRNLLVSRIFR